MKDLTIDILRKKKPPTMTEKVRQFHEQMGLETKGKTTDGALLNLRLDLVLEEMQELVEAAGFRSDDKLGIKLSEKPDPVEMLDAMADLVYVTVGWAVSHGWDFEEAFRRVHASNMTKIPKDGKIKYREDGKVLKPDTFTPPDLEDLVK